MDKLSWVFELLDRMSGPASKIASALDKVNTKTKTTESTQSLFSKGIGAIAKTFGPRAAGSVLRFAGSIVALGEKLPMLKPIIGVFGKIGGVAGKGMAIAGKGAMVAGAAFAAIGVAAATAITGLAFAGGRWAFDAIKFKENTLSSLSAILQSEDAATDVFNKATKFAARTPFATSEVASAFERLVAAGFKVGDLEKTMTSIGDFAGTDTQKLEGAISVLSQVRGKGKLATEELMQLAERGLPMQRVFDQLAKSLGKTTDEVQKMISAGAISGEQGVAAILAAMDATFGGRMEKSANTLDGLISTLKSVPEDLLFSPAMAKSIEAMIAPIRLFIKGITDAMAPDTDNGKRVIGIFTTIADTVGGVFRDLAGGDIKGTISKILDVVEPLVKIFLGFGKGAFEGLKKVLGPVLDAFSEIAKDPAQTQKLIDGMVKLGEAFGMVLGIVVAFIGAMVGLQVILLSTAVRFSEWLTELHTSFWAWVDGLNWAEIGASIALGIAKGLLDGATGGGFMTMLGDIIIAEFKQKMGIASPSKESQSWGVAIVEGLLLGITSMAGAVASALADLVKVPDLGIPGVGAKSSLIGPAPAGAPSGAGFADTGPSGGLFSGLPFMGPAAPAPVTTSLTAPPAFAAVPGPTPPAPPAGQPKGGFFSGLAGQLAALNPFGSATPSPSPNNPQNAIQPPTPKAADAKNDEAQMPRTQAFDFSGLIVNVNVAEGGEEGAKGIASSLADQIGAALKGLAGEAGG